MAGSGRCRKIGGGLKGWLHRFRTDGCVGGGGGGGGCDPGDCRSKNRRSSGSGGGRVSRCGCSRAGWPSVDPRCGQLCCRAAGFSNHRDGAQPARYRWTSGRRSAAGSRLVTPAGGSPVGWDERPRQCHGKSPATAAGGGIEPSSPTRPRPGQRPDPSQPSWPGTLDSAQSWRPSSGCAGRRSRSQAGSRWLIPMTQACGSPTRPSTSACMCRTVGPPP